MRTYLTSITKSPFDKTAARKCISQRIPASATIYADPAFSSDIMIPMKDWDAMILRPVTQYEYRFLHAVLDFGLHQIDELISLFSNKNPFNFGTTYRPRILTTVSDAEILAYAASVTSVKREDYYRISRYRAAQCHTVNVDKLVRSILRLQCMLHSSDLTIVPPRDTFPMHLVGRTDIIILNIEKIELEFLLSYVDELSLKGMQVMLVGGLEKGAEYYTHGYNVDVVPRRDSKGNAIHIVRNYQI